MSKLYYCGNCGLRLRVTRKALPRYGKIIEIVDVHECSETIAEVDFTEVGTPMYVPEGKNEFIQKLNALDPPRTIFDNQPKDRRESEHVKTSIAPPGILNAIKPMGD